MNTRTRPLQFDVSLIVCNPGKVNAKNTSVAYSRISRQKQEMSSLKQEKKGECNFQLVNEIEIQQQLEISNIKFYFDT